MLIICNLLVVRPILEKHKHSVRFSITNVNIENGWMLMIGTVLNRLCGREIFVGMVA
jgi:hypothetical protein